MPFNSARQEYFMMINHPDIWRKWVADYGHHSGFKAYVKKKKRHKSSSSKRTTGGKKPSTRRRKKKKRTR